MALRRKGNVAVSADEPDLCEFTKFANRMSFIVRSNLRLSKLRTRPFICSQSLFSKRFKHWNTKTMQQTVKSILVLGAGSFGSCLADHLGDSDHHVYLWSRSKEFCDHFNQHHRSIHQLKDHQFSTHITAVGPEFPDRTLIDKTDILLFAIPTEGVRCVFVQCQTVWGGRHGIIKIEFSRTEAGIEFRKTPSPDLRQQGYRS